MIYYVLCLVAIFALIVFLSARGFCSAGSHLRKLEILRRNDDAGVFMSECRSMGISSDVANEVYNQFYRWSGGKIPPRFDDDIVGVFLMDSDDFEEIVSSLEGSFSIDVCQSQRPCLKTVRDLLGYIECRATFSREATTGAAAKAKDL